MKKSISILLLLTIAFSLILTSCGKCAFNNHDYVEMVVVKPTLTEKGHSVFNCSICGDSYEADTTLDCLEKLVGTSQSEAELLLKEDDVNYTLEYVSSTSVEKGKVVSYKIIDDENLVLSVSAGEQKSLVGIEETHTNISETKLSIVDTTYWSDDEWSINDFNYENGVLTLNISVNYASEVRFILDKGTKASFGVGFEESSYDAIKAEKYEDIADATFEENVVEPYEDTPYSIPSDTFDFTLTIPCENLNQATETMYIKYSLELRTTSYSWSMDSFYVKLSLNWN